MISTLYSDTLEIKRVVKSEDKYGRTIQEFQTVQKDIKCRLSQVRLNPTQIGVVNKSVSAYKIFLSNNVEVRQNDNLIVNKGGIKYYFKASKVIKYTDFIPHQEIVVEEVEINEVETG